MTNDHREQARETIFYVVPRGARFSHVAVVHTATCPLAKTFRNARTWTHNPLDEDRFNRYQPCERCKPEPTGGWPSAASVAETVNQQQPTPPSRFDGMWGREIRARAAQERTAKEDLPSAALSSRDAEIKEVLEGLKAYHSECWCQPNGDDHSRDCLAARDLYAKLNSEAPAPTNTTPKRRRKSKRE